MTTEFVKTKTTQEKRNLSKFFDLCLIDTELEDTWPIRIITALLIVLLTAINQIERKKDRMILEQ